MKIYSIDEIKNDKSIPPAQLIGNGILLKQSLLLITGSKKAKKTFLAYNCGIALASGESFAGFNISSPTKVLMFSAEGGYYPNRDRITKMSKKIDFIDKQNFNICFDSRLKLEKDKDCNSIEEIIIEYEPEVLIIDPFVKFHSLDENSAQDMGKILTKLRNFIEDYNLSIILVHHLGKDQNLGARGSSAILGEYDSCITISKEGNDNRLKHTIDFDLRHAVSPGSRELIFNDETNWFEEEISPFIKILKEFGPMSKKELVELGKTKYHIPESSAYKKIDKLVADNKIYLDNDHKYNRVVVN